MSWTGPLPHGDAYVAWIQLTPANRLGAGAVVVVAVDVLGPGEVDVAGAIVDAVVAAPGVVVDGGAGGVGVAAATAPADAMPADAAKTSSASELMFTNGRG